MAILAPFASSCVMADLSCARSPIRVLYDNALESIVDDKSHTHTTDTLTHWSLGPSIRGLLGWLTWGIQMILTPLCLELTLGFGKSLL